jgi:hypothetical protein
MLKAAAEHDDLGSSTLITGERLHEPARVDLDGRAARESAAAAAAAAIACAAGAPAPYASSRPRPHRNVSMHPVRPQ